MADKTTEKEARIDQIVKDAIDAQEKMTGKPMSSEARHNVREAVTESINKTESQTKIFGETIAAGTYALDGSGISRAVRAEGAVAATQNAFSYSAVRLAFNEASGVGKGIAAALGRGAPALNVGFAAYDVLTAETTVERGEATGGFIGATFAAAGTGALIGSVVPGAGTLAVGIAGAFAGAAGYVIGKMTGGWVTEAVSGPEKSALSKTFDTKADGTTPPAPAPAPVQPVAQAARAPKLELIN